MEFNKRPGPEVFTIKYKPGTPISDNLRKLQYEFGQQKIGFESDQGRDGKDAQRAGRPGQAREVGLGRGLALGGVRLDIVARLGVWRPRSDLVGPPLDPKAWVTDKSVRPSSLRTTDRQAGEPGRRHGEESSWVSIQRHRADRYIRGAWFGLIVLLGVECERQAPRVRSETTKLDCGVNALFVLLRLEGRPVTLERLESVLPPRHPEGYSMAELARRRSPLGLGLEGVRFDKGDRALSISPRSRVPQGRPRVDISPCSGRWARPGRWFK